MASYLAWGLQSVRSSRKANAIARREIVVLLDAVVRRLESSADLFANRHYQELRSECIGLRAAIASIALERSDAARLLDQAGQSLRQIRTELIQLTEVPASRSELASA